MASRRILIGVVKIAWVIVGEQPCYASLPRHHVGKGRGQLATRGRHYMLHFPIDAVTPYQELEICFIKLFQKSS
jgi:hypothetical protein